MQWSNASLAKMEELYVGEAKTRAKLVTYGAEAEAKAEAEAGLMDLTGLPFVQNHKGRQRQTETDTEFCSPRMRNT